MKPYKLLGFVFSILAFSANAQLGVPKETFTRADTLRGSNTSPYRTCYDINYYHVDIKFDIADRSINGNVLFKFTDSTAKSSTHLGQFLRAKKQNENGKN